MLVLAIAALVAGVPAVATDQKPSKELLTVQRVLSGEFYSQPGPPVDGWLADGKSILSTRSSGRSGEDLIATDVTTGTARVLVPASKLQPKGADRPLNIERYWLSPDEHHLLIFTNSSRVWRRNTKGDFWVYDLPNGSLKKLGGTAEPSSLMFAKLSPDGSKAGYVYKNNLFVEELSSGVVTQLTIDGADQVINGTSDWVYEEELDIRDGWRWSPDSRRIAYWQFQTSMEPIYTLIDDTDALYPTVKRYPYPKAGQTNPTVRVGVVAAAGGPTTWTQQVADNESGYLARVDWIDANRLLIQHLNRLQNRDDYLLTDADTGKEETVFSDTDPAWVDLPATGDRDDGVRLTSDGKQFLTTSERDGWRHLYLVGVDDRKVRLLTEGKYDVDSVAGEDPVGKQIYFIASPDNAIQRYLYRAALEGPAKVERLTPVGDAGTNGYEVSPTGAYALRTHSSFGVPSDEEVVHLPDHAVVRTLVDNVALKAKMKTLKLGKSELIQLDAADGEKMDVSIIYPPDFDPAKKYPVFFNVYGEPAGLTVTDSWDGDLFHWMLSQQGYIVASVDNRGTPSLKGRAWRKSIYRKIGVIASADQAAAVKQLEQRPYVDASRIGIWGWSGGGSMTLNVMFRYPDLYKLGMSVAPVPDIHLYDSIYQERYMGLPQDHPKDYDESSPITFVGQLKGSLLIVHGSGDDNVHYQGTERLVNKLVALDKPFQLMVYPNRSHGIYEGPGTREHLYELLYRFLTTNMPPGPK